MDAQMTDATSEVEVLSGYDTCDRYWATRYMQGGRTVYQIDLSLDGIISTVDIDPDVVSDTNRPIDKNHAEKFGNYVIAYEEWVSPPLHLNAPTGLLAFKSQPTSIKGVDFGILSVPRLAIRELRVLGGQHRVYGLHLAAKRIHDEIRRHRGLLATAERNGEPTVDEYRAELQKWTDIRDRFGTERMTLQIVVADDPSEVRQMFNDIADNAKGISRSTVSGFDRRQLVNRALPQIKQHPLLDGRIDPHRDRFPKDDVMLMGNKQVADMARAVQVGTVGRISVRREAELTEKQVVQDTWAFLDMLVAARPELQAMQAGKLKPGDLRDVNLLGSMVIYRVLAGAYHDLLAGSEKCSPMSGEEVRGFLAGLDFTAPLSDGSPWRETGAFKEPYMYPMSRMGDLRSLTNAIVAWACEGRSPKVAPA